MGVSTNKEIRVLAARMEAREAAQDYGDLVDRNFSRLQNRSGRHMPALGVPLQTHTVSINEAKRIALKNKTCALLTADNEGFFFPKSTTVIGPKSRG